MTADNINALVGAAGGSVPPFFASLFAKLCDAQGDLSGLMKFGGGGGGVAAPAASGGGGGGPAAAEEEEKKVEERKKRRRRWTSTCLDDRYCGEQWEARLSAARKRKPVP